MLSGVCEGELRHHYAGCRARRSSVAVRLAGGGGFSQPYRRQAGLLQMCRACQLTTRRNGMLNSTRNPSLRLSNFSEHAQRWTMA